MFHDMGLTHQHSSEDRRFEVVGANVARDFLRSQGIAQQDIDTVWTAIALHTTPGIPEHMHPKRCYTSRREFDGQRDAIELVSLSDPALVRLVHGK